MITGVTFAAILSDPSLDEDGAMLVAAAFLAALDPAARPDLAAWADASGYYAEAVTATAVMRS